MHKKEAACGAPGGPRSISGLKFSGHPAMARTRPIYPTKYAGTCCLCGWPVPAGFGYTERGSDGRWAVFH